MGIFSYNTRLMRVCLDTSRCSRFSPSATLMHFVCPGWQWFCANPAVGGGGALHMAWALLLGTFVCVASCHSCFSCTVLLLDAAHTEALASRSCSGARLFYH